MEFNSARYEAEMLMQERVVHSLVNLLLEDDKEAIFAYRHNSIEQSPIKMPNTVPIFLTIGLGSLIGFSINPQIDLAALAAIGGLLGLRSYKRYKNEEREVLTMPAERLQIKI